MFGFIYKKLYLLGLYTARFLSRLSRRLIRFLAKPVKALGALVMAGLLLVDRFVISHIRNVAAETGELYREARATIKEIFSIFKGDKKRGWSVFKFNVRKAFNKHDTVFSVLTNVVAPAFALVILLFTIHHWNSQQLGLKITYNNSDIGYVSSESVYLAAQSKAQERLQTAIVANEGENVIKTAQYKIATVSLTDYNDSEAIANKLIERSDSNITNACGIYIDNEFLCAVKNETDAMTVFDNILENYTVDDPNAIVSFVEDISYRQGMYPDNDNTVWDAVKLSDKLGTKKSEAIYYTVASGDTPSGIAQRFGISTSEIYALNPSIGNAIHVGDKILVKSEVNFVRVQVTKTEQHTELLPYRTVTIETSNLYKGVKKTVQNGQKGEQLVTELVTYIDGVRVSAKEIGRVTTKEPVEEKIQVGTKAYASSGYGSASYGTVKSYGGNFVWPAIGAYNISSYFGGRRGHGGIDIVKAGGNSTGCPIVAAASGRVVSASYHSSWGYNVLIDHGNGLQTRYAHMLPGSFKVSSGQRVSAGQQLGNIGSSGNVTGPHLHFEVYVNGRRVNPLPYLGR